MLSCRALLARGDPITHVAQWVGHKDINVTYAFYVHLVPNAADRGCEASSMPSTRNGAPLDDPHMPGPVLVQVLPEAAGSLDQLPPPPSRRSSG